MIFQNKKRLESCQNRFSHLRRGASGGVKQEFIMHTSHLPFVVKLDEFTRILLDTGTL
jgi:hypothetical protein